MVGRFSIKETLQEQGYRQGLIAGLTYELVPVSSADAAIQALPPSSPVSVTCSPVRGIDATVELTDRIRAFGHHPLPHVAARMVEGPEHVARLARWLRTEDIGRLFVIGGDAHRPAGPYSDAFSFLRDLLDAAPGLHTVGVPAYPDNHPFIEPQRLHEALYAKQDLLAQAGIDGFASTQMCFDPAKISNWLHAEREAGLTLPIHLGVAGVVDRTKLMAMGVRLGIGASLRFLRKNRSALGRLMSSGSYDPNKLLEALSPILEPYGVTGIHCFTFNQVEATAHWQRRTLE